MENNPFFLIITIYLLELGSSECAENFFALAYDKECRLFHGLEFNELISVLKVCTIGAAPRSTAAN